MVWAINIKVGRHTVHGSCLACIDPEVKRSNVKVMLSNVLPALVCMSIGLFRFSYTPQSAWLCWCDCHDESFASAVFFQCTCWEFCFCTCSTYCIYARLAFEIWRGTDRRRRGNWNRASLIIECKRSWNRPVTYPMCQSLCLSRECIVTNWLIGSGCCLRWWVGSLEGWVY